MWRSFFLAVGISLVVIGFECLGVERVVLRIHDPPPLPILPFQQPAAHGPAKQISPPSWAPWSLMSTGAIVCIYSFTLPARFKPAPPPSGGGS